MLYTLISLQHWYMERAVRSSARTSTGIRGDARILASVTGFFGVWGVTLALASLTEIFHPRLRWVAHYGMALIVQTINIYIYVCIWLFVNFFVPYKEICPLKFLYSAPSAKSKKTQKFKYMNNYKIKLVTDEKSVWTQVHRKFVWGLVEQHLAFRDVALYWVFFSKSRDEIPRIP